MSMNSHAHMTFKRYEPKRYGNAYCQKRTLIRGELHVCNEPTEGGKTYCAQCERRLITLTDRAAPTPIHGARCHPWSEDIAAKSRKKRRRQAA